MPAEYLLRLDDACPTMDLSRWETLLQLLTARRIRPIIAVVPANADPALLRRPPDPLFWQRARTWARDGCLIGLHGYSHALRPSPGGLVQVRGLSEFVGLPIDEQRRRIREGVRVLESNGLTPEVWVAPAHGFDSFTLHALRVESEIRIISDGFTRRAVRKDDFVWLPQQLWRPRFMKTGLWTVCLHPDEMDDESLRAVDTFLSAGQGSFPDPRVVGKEAAAQAVSDALFAAAFGAALRLRTAARKIKRKVHERA